jgi:hypothetical protein
MTIRADVRRALGPQTPLLRRYYEAYKREFRVVARHSSKEELLKQCVRSDIVLLGDYHTFAQSQKAALRLLRELANWESPLALGLEMVPTTRQAELDEFMAGKLGEKEFLERIDYDANWGFPWENFKPILAFAREHQIPVIALNFESQRLEARDAHAARAIAAWAWANPKRKLFVLYGDLHLARGHIPKLLRQELRERALKKRVLTIFQNSESLYWRLAENRMAHAVDVLALGRGRYCIMNAAPWVKLQSFLEWVDKSSLLNAGEWESEGAGPNLHEIAHERLRALAEALNLRLPPSLDFTVQTVNDLSFLTNSAALAGISRNELKAVKYHVLGNRGIFIPGANMMYLASTSVNSLCEGVSSLAHAVLSGTRTIFHDPREHFFTAALHAALAYFGSKVLNHKRKCDLEDDFRLLLERPASRGMLPAERLQRRAAKLVLRHCKAQRDYLRSRRYRAPIVAGGPGRVPVFLETARCIGFILGEKLYASFVEGRYPMVKIERLFMTKLSSPSSSRTQYLKLVTELERAPLGHTSKLDLF